jgi:HEAT repeat protein
MDQNNDLSDLHNKLSSNEILVREMAAQQLGLLADVRSIPYLVASLSDPFVEVRWEAEAALVKIGQPAVSPLINALSTGGGQAVCEALGSIGGQEAVDALINAMADPELCWCATHGIQHLKHESVAELLRLIDHPDSEVRICVFDTLIDFEMPNIAPMILPKLQDPDGEVRTSAIVTLLHNGGYHFLLPHLIAALENEESSVRAHAGQFLGQKKEINAVDALISHLSDEGAAWYSQKRLVQVSEVAANALAEIGTPKALAAVEAWRASQATNE